MWKGRQQLCTFRSVSGEPISTRFEFEDGEYLVIANRPPGTVLTSDQVQKFRFRRSGEDVSSETQPGYLFNVRYISRNNYGVWARRADGVFAETHIPYEMELPVNITGENYMIARFGDSSARESVSTSLAFDIPFKKLYFKHESIETPNNAMTIDLTNSISIPPELSQQLYTNNLMRTKFKMLLNKIRESLPMNSPWNSTLLTLLDYFT
tara:strand:- start:82 stop:708 length:627 start_codon:yes stop_codon:yes gene_type:complete